MAERVRAGGRAGGRARGLLALGAALGLAAAALGLMRGGPGAAALPAGAVAVVNGEPIATETWARALAALAADRRDPLGEQDKRRVLDRLIEEELLVQRGLELGLARYDRRVRADLVSAVIDGIVAEAEDREASESELAAFYAENRDWFMRPGRLRVRRVWVATPAGADVASAEARAREAARRLRAGEPLEQVASQIGDPPVAEVPDALLTPAKLREYLGPTALRTALELDPGEVSEPVRAAGGFHVVLLTGREAEQVAPLDEIREVVGAEWRRRAGERALRSYLDRLREEGEVSARRPLP
jgi:parvulin-like peptidyl-prolyl isomerase